MTRSSAFTQQGVLLQAAGHFVDDHAFHLAGLLGREPADVQSDDTGIRNFWLPDTILGERLGRQ